MWRWLRELWNWHGSMGGANRVDFESFTRGWEGLSNKINAERDRVAESLSLALDAAQMGQWDLDLVHDSARRSLRHDQIFGYPSLRPEWGWQVFMKHVVPEDRNAVTEQFRNATQKGGTFNIECRIVWADQSTHWIAARGRAYLNDQGVPVRLAGVVMDITERKQAEEAMRRDRALLQAIHHAQTQFILAEDPLAFFAEFLKSLLTLTNSEYGFIDEMFYAADGKPFLTARAITDISWNDESRKMYQQFLSGTLNFNNLKSLYGVVMESGKPVIANDAPHDPRRTGIPTGHPPLRAFLGLPLLSNSKEFVGVIGLANRPGGYTEEVITYLEPMVAACANLIAARKNDQRRQLAEQEIKRYAADLERSNRDLDQFAYSASHDLKAPLRAVDNLAQWIAEDAGQLLPEASQRDLALMRQRIDRMQRLLDDLLAYSRVGRTQHKLEAVDTAVLVRGVVDLLALPAGFTVVSGDLPALVTYKAPLEQVFRNLIGNAVKHHHRQDGKVEVSATDRGDFVEFVVRDDGPGIPPEFHERVFEMFQTLKPRDQVEGSGMGLALVKKIVENQGGTIILESTFGSGALFRFSWPRRRGESA